MQPVSEEFIEFLEENPEFYSIMHSYTFLKVLRFIAEKARTFNDLLLAFPSIDEQDLQLIVGSLTNIKAISKVKISESEFYVVTDKARLFLKKYKKTKEKLVG